jgi:hypothetical protein
MRLADILPPPEEFHRLSHDSNMLTERESTEILKWVDSYFRPVLTACMKECGPQTSNPILEMSVSLSMIAVIEHVLRITEKEKVQ